MSDRPTHALEHQLQQQAEQLARANEELQRREHVMRELLGNLQAAKQELETERGHLEAANQRLQQLAILKDEFVAKVSHELRTPLTSIKEGVSLLVDRALGQINAEQEDFLKTIDGEIDRLAELINDMLDISKIEAGRLRLVRRRLNVRPLLDTLVRSHQPAAGRRTVRIDGGDIPSVFADADRMIQVLTNLLSNAVKFTDDRGHITFRLGQQNGHVTIAVQDDGPGIAPNDLSKLFQKFSQVGHRDPNRPRGTGLGLALCKELMELQRGGIDVVSTPGSGSTFTVSLPVYSDAFAMEDSLRELVELTPPGDHPTVGLLAIDVERLLASVAGVAQPSRAALEGVAEDVQRHIHRGDLVLAIEPRWVVVLASTDAAGCQAMVQRLRGALRGAAEFRFGTAAYPTDAATASELFAHASRLLDQGLATPSRSRP